MIKKTWESPALRYASNAALAVVASMLGMWAAVDYLKWNDSQRWSDATYGVLVNAPFILLASFAHSALTHAFLLWGRKRGLGHLALKGRVVALALALAVLPLAFWIWLAPTIYGLACLLPIQVRNKAQA
jgi:hypothetical protein